MTDSQLERMSEEIEKALEPLREWFQKIEDGRPIRGTDFETAHEDVEILLMKVVDNWYGAGFKDGVAEEKASWEYNNA